MSEISNEADLDRLFHAYRQSSPDPEPGNNFMPELWAKIEARENSTNWFSRIAKGLVTAAVTASVILGLLISTAATQQTAPYNGTFVEALMAHFQAERLNEELSKA